MSYFDAIKFIKIKLKDGTEKTFARQLGSAKQRDDGGFEVYLDAQPLDGKFSILPQRQRQASAGGAATKNPADIDDEIPF